MSLIPNQDLLEFAKDAMQRHEAMQAATRREVSSRPKETVRTFTSAGPTRPFSNSALKKAAEVTPPQETAASVSASTGAFYGLYDDSSGDTYLQGGQIKAGSGTFTLDDFLVVDGGSGIVADDGDRLVLKLTVSGYEEDSVLLAGLTATAGAYVTPHVATVDDDTLPEVGDTTGKFVFIEIGRWTADSFLPSAMGNIIVSFCPGQGYSIERY